ncbi:hypothetical protein BJY04DRAFT_180050 [Aspergillus karnatakaensis]|uniref:SIMPL domain-containing protein n=1 Tax=Aspergillus karnatakaensis TaxID=1810916 RepID=UPI003CCD9FB6
MPPLTITTTGHATLTHPAELALLRLTIKDTGAKPANAISNVQAAAGKVRAILDTYSQNPAPPPPTTPSSKLKFFTERHSKTHSQDQTHEDEDQGLNKGAITTYSTSDITTTITWKHESSSRMSKLHAAYLYISVEFVEFKALAAVAREISGLEFVTVKEVEWKLTEETKGTLASEGRVKAARDAIGRAKDYGSVLGEEKNVEAVEVVEKKNTGSGKDGAGAGGDGGGFRVVDMYRDRDQSGSDFGVSFQPPDIEFRVEITVRFVAE